MDSASFSSIGEGAMSSGSSELSKRDRIDSAIDSWIKHGKESITGQQAREESEILWTVSSELMSKAPAQVASLERADRAILSALASKIPVCQLAKRMEMPEWAIWMSIGTAIKHVSNLMRQSQMENMSADSDGGHRNVHINFPVDSKRNSVI